VRVLDGCQFCKAGRGEILTSRDLAPRIHLSDLAGFRPGSTAFRIVEFPPRNMPLPHQFLCPSLRFITPRTPPSIATFSKTQPSLRITSKSSFITNTRPFSSTAKMGVTAYFDVEYTTADGQPRKHWATPAFLRLLVIFAVSSPRPLLVLSILCGILCPLISMLTAMFAS
jgi:hypothetical protein